MILVGSVFFATHHAHSVGFEYFIFRMPNGRAQNSERKSQYWKCQLKNSRARKKIKKLGLFDDEESYRVFSIMLVVDIHS